MERIYYLNNEEKTLDEILIYIKQKLMFGDAKEFTKLSIDFQDFEDFEKFEVYLTPQERQEILDKSKNGILDYKDDTELCFYKKGQWSIYLAIYDGHLEWTLNKHYSEGNWDNLFSKIWDTKNIQDLYEVDLYKYARTYFYNLKTAYKEEENEQHKLIIK